MTLTERLVKAAWEEVLHAEVTLAGTVAWRAIASIVDAAQNGTDADVQRAVHAAERLVA